VITVGGSFLPELADYHFVDIDPASVEQAVFAAYEDITKRPLFPGQPERIFCEFMAYLLAHERVNLDMAARSQLLAYAQGVLLDHIGARSYCQRLPAAPARAELAVTLNTVLTSVWIMPQGTRVTADSKIIFATTENLLIQPGHTEGRVDVVCATAGADGNGYKPSQLSRLVDPLPYVASVANATETSGGADVEDDDRYRERIHLAPAQWSTAGPDDAYRYWAMSAHQEIADVAVYSPAPVEVELYVLLTDGRIPDEAVLDLVRGIFARRDRVPLTDLISVHPPVPVPYSLSVTWWLDRDRQDRAGAVRLAAERAVSDFTAWQKSRIGRDLNPSELTRLIMQAGAKRVQVDSPAFTVLQAWELAMLEGVPELHFGGVENV
jgi:phage-related baseplate assembly protein